MCIRDRGEGKGKGEGEGGDGKRSQSVRDSRKKQKHNPQTNSGTPLFGLGRDTKLFQIGESHNRFGCSSNSETDIYMIWMWDAVYGGLKPQP